MPGREQGSTRLAPRAPHTDPARLAPVGDVVGPAVDADTSAKFNWPWAGTPGRAQRIGITAGPLSFGAAHCGGPQHFALGVERARIAELKSRLESLGVEVEGPVEFRFWNAESIYFSDPAGNRVEFCGFEAPA